MILVFRKFEHDFHVNRNLGNNLITCVKDRTFSKLEQLQTLTLSENEMASLQREVFGERIPNLVRLLVLLSKQNFFT